VSNDYLFIIIAFVAGCSIVLTFSTFFVEHKGYKQFVHVFTPTLFAAIFCICMTALGFIP
jgi:hypothetical protein